MNGKRILYLSKLFLILILTGNISLTAQDNSDTKSGGCGISKTKTSVSNANVINADASNANVLNTSAGEFDARRWNLIEIGGEAVESSKAFVEFTSAEKRFAGNAGCNRMFGKYEASGNQIKFSGIGATKMFCSAEGTMKLEANFIKYLESATRFERARDTLVLYAGENPVLKFSGAAKNTNSGNDSGGNNSNTIKLEDKKWILTAIAGKPVPKFEKAAFLVFDEQKQSAGGDSGCNSFGGSYQIKADKIGFSEIIQTFIACEVERGSVDREFLGGLRKANQFAIKAGKLSLFENDKLLLTFDAAEEN